MNLGTILSREEKSVTSAGMVAADEEFFQDHFPEFPVVPGVMTLEILKRTAEKYFNDSSAAFALSEIRNVKFSSYLRPGDSWEARVDLVSNQGAFSEWKAKLICSGRTACSAQFKLRRS